MMMFFQKTIDIPIQIIPWICPPSSYSQHQDYCIFTVANPKLLIIICYQLHPGVRQCSILSIPVDPLGGETLKLLLPP